MTTERRLLTGLADITEDIERRDRAGGDGLPELRVKSGETAILHFMTEGSDVIESRFHSIPRQAGQFTIHDDVHCPAEVGEECPSWCVNGTDEIKRRYVRWFAWVWVHGIVVPANATVPATADIQQVQMGTRTVSYWNLEAPALLKRGEGNNRTVIQQLIRAWTKYGTLLERKFEWARTGTTRNDTTYFLDAGDVEEFQAPADKVSELPPLDKIILENMPLKAFPDRKGGGESNDSGNASTTSGGDSNSKLLGMLGGASGEKDNL